MGGTSVAQKVGPLFGVVFIVLGIIGFLITGFDDGFTAVTGHELLGMGLNAFHNLAYILAGVFLIVMCVAAPPAAAEGATIGIGLFLVVLFILGVVAGDNLTIIGMTGEGDTGNFLHLIVGVTLLAVGLLSSGATASQAKKRGLA